MCILYVKYSNGNAWTTLKLSIIEKIYRCLFNPSPMCHTYASVNRVRIGSDNGLSPIWHQAII